MAIKSPKVDSKEYEQTIIGMALADPKTAEAVSKLPGELFYYSRHRGILHGIKRLVEKKAVVDIMALVAELGDEFLFAVAECGNKGIDPALLRQRTNELRNIRFKHKISSLSEDTTPEELEELIKKYKPSAEEDKSYIPDKDNLFRKIEHYAKHGGLKTYRTGWNSMNEFYEIALGQLTVVTGIPGSGKSTWVDNLMVNLAVAHGWKICMFSPESYPIEQHYGRLIEIHSGASMLLGMTAVPKITAKQLEESFNFVYDHIKCLYIPPEERTIDGIMSQVTDEYSGFVLDPWNEIEHRRRSDQTETEYIGEALMRFKAYGVFRNFHVWIVAHPKKLVKEKDGSDYAPPDPYDISGSANWYNKADMAITVHRNNEFGDIHIKKVRVRGTGKLGTVKLKFDRENQRYEEEMVI